jgi:hypothetical protein
MKAVVVYESHWGNTEAVARAIAGGIGPGAAALSTDAAAGSVISEADLVVAGAPIMAFGLPSEKVVSGIKPGANEPSPDLDHPTMRTWLGGVPNGHGAYAAFETKLHWSPGGATGAIETGLRNAGYHKISAAHKFEVTSKTGPLRDGELERARLWGTELAAQVRVELGEPAPV